MGLGRTFFDPATICANIVVSTPLGEPQSGTARRGRATRAAGTPCYDAGGFLRHL
jgi:hypothetical protein